MTMNHSNLNYKNNSSIIFQLLSNLYLSSYLVTLIVIILSTLIAFNNSFQSPIWQILITFISGYILWCIIEYLTNRFLMHAFTKKGVLSSVYEHHKMHHSNPKEIKYIVMPFPVIAIITFIISTIFTLLLPQLWSLVTSGFLTGYLIFIIIHTSTHYIPISNRSIFSFLWKSHILHHSKFPHKAFSVSAPILDKIFITAPGKYDFLILNPEVIENKSTELSVTEVIDIETENAFFKVPQSIYKNNPNWIAPIDSEIKAIFNKEKNPYFNHGTIKRWILLDQHGVIIGRIAAFIDFHKMYEGDKKLGAIGFFECIDDKKAAFCLFDIAVKWLKDYYQIQMIDGPVNFGENDKYWGLLIDGFGYPSYGMNYNPPYYKTFFEAYGFKINYSQITNLLDLGKPLPERVVSLSNRVLHNQRYHFKHFNYKETTNFVKDFATIYNQAWASFKNFQPIDEAYLLQSLMEIKSIVEETFIWFAYAEGRPIGLVVGMPDVNELLRYFNGKISWLGKLKFLYLKTVKGFSTARVVIMGVIPEYQNLGIESALIYKAYSAGKNIPGYENVQLAWVGDFNRKMLAVHKAMGAVPDKKHATFRFEC